MVVGLIRQDEGKVILNGKDVSDLPMFQRARMGIGYLPQEPSVFRKLTVEENILAILETQGLGRQTRKKKARDLMEELKIFQVRKSKGFSLSGGERRRVEICRALAIEPLFILLDEPFAGIDPIVVGDIQNMVAQLKNFGIGVLITDHNVRETLQIVDRAYILNEGEILESGSPEKIAKSQKVRDIYLGERFSLGN